MYRYVICYNDKDKFYIKQNKKLKGDTIQILYKVMRSELEIERIFKRRKFIVCLPPSIPEKKNEEGSKSLKVGSARTGQRVGSH